MDNQGQSQQPKRPQEPQSPFPYNEEEVTYENRDTQGVLAGTLTLPRTKKLCPAVILIAGYGRYDRDVTGMGHKYFLVLADYLTRQGIAVLRFDKRGIGKSTGDYDRATSLDFASDVQAGITYLKTRKDLNQKQIGLIGLSEGGLIASIVAARSRDVAFATLMAPAVLTQVNDLVEMTALQMRADGASEEFIKDDKKLRTAIYSLIKQQQDHAVAQKELAKMVERYLTHLPEAQKSEAENLPFAFTHGKADMMINTFNSPWYRFFLAYDPTIAFKQITIPVLVINGDRDWIAVSKKAFPVLEKSLEQAGNKDYTLMELPNLNHLFQTCKTGAIVEYTTLEETIAPAALQMMADWILARVVN